MSSFLLHVNASVMCPHAGNVSAATTNTRVKVGGQSAVVQPDTFTVAGCPFQVPIGTGTKPQPCVRAQWVTAAVRVKIGGRPALLHTSSGICQSAEQIPQGAPNVVSTQTRVKGT
jgi:hypothetical protein